MRIYKRYRYNLASHCKFAQTYSEAEAFLRQNGLCYQNALFHCRNSGLNIEHNGIGKVLRKYPELKKYLTFSDDTQQSILSNCDLLWACNTEDDDKELVGVLSSKVPRPFSFALIKVVLNRISFFNRDSGQSVSENTIMWDESPLSSSICFWKWFDSGIKYNLAHLTIDVTADEAGSNILDDSEYARAFETFFECKPERTETIVSAPELTPCPEVQNEIDRILAEASESLARWEGAEEKLEDMPLPKPEANGVIIIDVGIHYSFKISINLKKRKASGYEYISYDNGCYFLRKRDSFNHAIELDICTAPMCRRIDTFITYRGMTFRYHFQMSSFTPQDQSEADRYMEALLDVMASFEASYLRRIGALHPGTPDWFIF